MSEAKQKRYMLAPHKRHYVQFAVAGYTVNVKAVSEVSCLDSCSLPHSLIILWDGLASHALM